MKEKIYKSYLTFINGEVRYNVQYIEKLTKTNKKGETTTKVDHRLCYVFSENGYSKCRNVIYNNFFHNYFCKLPKDLIGTYLESGNEWDEWNNEYEYINLHSYTLISENDKKILTKKYPDFSYTLNKYIKAYKTQHDGILPTVIDCFNLYRFWQEHKECEFVIMSNYLNIVFNKSFYKMTQRRQKEIMKFLHQYNSQIPHYANLKTILKIQKALKNRLLNESEINAYFHFIECKNVFNSIEDFHYFEKQEKITKKSFYEIHNLYNDYITLAKALNKDLNSPYHRYPTKLQERHDKLHLQKERLNEINLQNKQKNYFKTVKKYQKFNFDNFDGYKIYIPNDVIDIQKQAHALTQCLISCDYISQVINKYCVLVFIRDTSNTPIATAQILPNGNVGQFYAKANSYPSEQVKDVFNKWLKKSKIKISA